MGYINFLSDIGNQITPIPSGALFWLMPTLANSDFGQTDFGQPKLADFGQSLLAFLFKKKNNKMKKQSMEETRKVGAPKGGAPKGGRPTFRAFSSLSRHHFALFVSLWVSSRGICPGGPEAAGVSHDSPRAQTCTFLGSGASNTTKIQREDTQRDTKRAKRWREWEEKKSEILGGLA